MEYPELKTRFAELLNKRHAFAAKRLESDEYDDSQLHDILQAFDPLYIELFHHLTRLGSTDDSNVQAEAGKWLERHEQYI